MVLKIEILEEKKNFLIDRVEIRFRVDHFGEGTPNRLEIKKQISAMQGSNEKLTIVKNLETKFGSPYSTGLVFMYETAEELKTREPEPGYTIQECYDLINHRPKPDFLKAYLQVKNRLNNLDLNF